MWTGISARSLTPATLKGYLGEYDYRNWKPKGLTLHHTAAPSLAQRPNNLTLQHIRNIEDFYKQQGWHAGPTFFIDRVQIWGFSPPNDDGVHAKGFNDTHISIENLGDYDTEEPSAEVWHLCAQASLTIMEFFGFKENDPVWCPRIQRNTTALNFHRDDPLTTKTCPGKKITRQFVLDLIEIERAKRQVIAIFLNGKPLNVPGYLKDGHVWVNPDEFRIEMVRQGKDVIIEEHPTLTMITNLTIKMGLTTHFDGTKKRLDLAG